MKQNWFKYQYLLIAVFILPMFLMSGCSGTSTNVDDLKNADNKDCCKICKASKACGDSCIKRDYTCNKPPGCACDAY